MRGTFRAMGAHSSMTSPRRRAIAMGLLLAGAYGAMLVAAARVSAGEAGAPDPGAPAPGAAGLRIYLDPDTGQAGPPPRGVLPGEPVTESLSTSSAGLVETAGTSAAGGVTVNLQGRFRRAMQATADDAGAARIDCVPGAVAVGR